MRRATQPRYVAAGAPKSAMVFHESPSRETCMVCAMEQEMMDNESSEKKSVTCCARVRHSWEGRRVRELVEGLIMVGWVPEKQGWT